MSKEDTPKKALISLKHLSNEELGSMRNNYDHYKPNDIMLMTAEILRRLKNAFVGVKK
jgi:hypothetical protein